jgi:RNA polymerase subunit RPABC4/transcription elongation factor Spt4
MDLGSIFLGLALLLVTVFIVARPILLGAHDRERAARGEADALLFRRERLLIQLRDLDFDHATGKIADDDYAAQRAGLVAEGVEVLKALDTLGLSAAPSNGAAGSPEDEIEAAIAQARGLAPLPPDEAVEAAVRAARQTAPAAPAAATARACGNCGAGVQPDDRFCPKCGAPQALACPHCGRPAQAGDVFCGGCGQRLPAVEAPN